MNDPKGAPLPRRIEWTATETLELARNFAGRAALINDFLVTYNAMLPAGHKRGLGDVLWQVGMDVEKVGREFGGRFDVATGRTTQQDAEAQERASAPAESDPED